MSKSLGLGHDVQYFSGWRLVQLYIHFRGIVSAKVYEEQSCYDTG